MTVRYNIGCGGRRIAGYIGVDAVKRDTVDIVAKADRIPVPGNEAEEIMAIHLWEHFYLWQCEDVIREWKRILKPGGHLILELPNLRKCCENFLNPPDQPIKHPHQLNMWGLYGDPRDKSEWMMHRWGWTPESLTEFLLAHGFKDVVEAPTRFHVVGRDHRDMRIEAVLA